MKHFARFAVFPVRVYDGVVVTFDASISFSPVPCVFEPNEKAMKSY